MLEMEQSIFVKGRVVINQKVAITLNADISTENSRSSFINQNIADPVLYNQNRAECRKGVQEFQEKVWELEDQFLKTGSVELIEEVEG